MSYHLGAFSALERRLDDAIFAQYAEVVSIQKPNQLPQVLSAVVDRNVQAFAPMDAEVVEPIIEFTFRLSESGKLPTRTLIGFGDINEFGGDPAEFWEMTVDRLDPSRRSRNTSADDGSIITYLARYL